MINHVNGWNVIERYLQKHQLKQHEFAKALNISSSAISQIKNGKFYLNEAHINKIIMIFEFNKQESQSFYTSMMIARDERTFIKKKLTISPLYELKTLTFETLKEFDPHQSSFHRYLNENSQQSMKYLHNKNEFGVIVDSSFIGLNISQKVLIILLNDRIYQKGPFLIKDENDEVKIVNKDNFQSSFQWGFTVVKIIPQLYN